MNLESLPILRRGLMDWDKALLPAEEFAEREEAARKIMREAGVGSLVVVAKPAHDGDLGFLTSYSLNTIWIFMTAAAVLGLDEPTTLVVSTGPRDLPGVIRRVPCKVESAASAATPTTQVAVQRAVEKAAAMADKVGVVNLANMPAKIQAAVEDILKDRMVDLTPAYKKLRASRRPRELTVMGQVGPMVVNRILSGFFTLKPGQAENHLRATIERGLRSNGCEDANVLLASGNPSPSIHIAEQRKIEVGDTVQVFVGAHYRKYWAAAARSAVAGRASESQRKMWSALSAAYRGVLDSLKAGFTMGQAAKAVSAAEEVLKKAGYGAAYAACQMIGLDFTEDTGPVPADEFVLPSGSTLLVALGAFDQAGDRMMAADVVLTEDGGVTPLTIPLQESLYTIPFGE